jgi:hypothetical protein
MSKSPNAIDLMAKLFKPDVKPTAGDRARSELAAATKARDENMERLRQLRLQRDAMTLPADTSAKARTKSIAALRKPAKSGRA